MTAPLTISEAEQILWIPQSEYDAISVLLSPFIAPPSPGRIFPRLGFGYAHPQFRTSTIARGIRKADNSAATSECQDCKIFVPTKNLRHRDWDGVLVCPECNFVTPVKRNLVGPENLPPRISSPIAVPEPPPPLTVIPVQDMRVRPDYRRP